MLRVWLFLLLLGATISASAWGFFGHRKINETAVFVIPKPLFGFYKYHINYMVEHAADPDKRRYIVETEACKHYLDGDHYEKKVPFDTLPRWYKKAVEKYTEDTILAHGIVPWQILQVVYQLTEAFKVKDIERILKLSADLGHYVGDCHVPLHATSNYNGQKTGQKGIHALWESRLTELYFEDFDMYTGMADYINNPSEKVWQAFERSYSLVDSVLRLEQQVSQDFSELTKYSWEQRGAVMVKVYSKVFCEAYHEALGDMVEARLRASVVLLGSLLYTAWVDAGQPVLDTIPVELPETVVPEKAVMKGREEE